MTLTRADRQSGAAAVRRSIERADFSPIHGGTLFKRGVCPVQDIRFAGRLCAREATMRNSKPDLRRDLDSIKADVVALQADLSAALKDLVSVSKSEAGEVKDRLESQLREKLSRLSDKADDLAQRGRRAVEGLEGAIEEKPLQSVGIALGVGLLIGVLLARK